MKFVAPEMEVIKFDACDVLTASTGDSSGDDKWNTGGDDL